MQLSVIIVTFNHQSAIKESLMGLTKNLPGSAEVIIVDNASTDRTVDEARSVKGVKIIEADKNLGFSRGCNLGANVASGEYLFFLNPDTRVVDDAIAKLLEYIKQHQDVGLVAPRLMLPDGQVQPSVTKLPTLSGAISEYYFHKPNAYGEYVPEGFEPVEVEAVYGAAMMVAKKNFDKVGGFDERYFLFYEDLDLCRKIGSLGLKIVYLPNFKVVHLLGESTKKISRSELPVLVRTLALFWPMKSSGAVYYQILSGNIYHGSIIAFLIRLLIYLARK